MVIAGVEIDKKYERKLKALGVRDSKELSPKKREQLAPEIEKLASSVIVLRVQACKIDDFRARGINLDRIEAMKMAQIIDMSVADKVYVDSLQFNSNKFKKMIMEFLSNNNRELIVENYSDETYPVVSAASIIAKVERDKAIDEIKKRVGVDFGVGYSHDERTIKFVEKLIKENKWKMLPPYVRKSWITTQMLKEKSLQRRLKDFIFRNKEECRENEG